MRKNLAFIGTAKSAINAKVPMMSENLSPVTDVRIIETHMSDVPAMRELVPLPTRCGNPITPAERSRSISLRTFAK